MSIKDIQQIYDSQNHRELADRYDEWAKNYDRELVDDCRYVAPEKVAEVFLRFVPKDAKILDAGAGTGLVGQVLHQHGYTHLEAIDLSAEMLAQARQKDVYRALYQKALGEPLELPTNSFDAIVSVGTFTYGHAPSHSFDELIRIAKPGGYIIFTLRLDFYEQSDFKPKFSELEKAEKWTLVEMGDRFSPLATAPPSGYYRVWVYRVS